MRFVICASQTSLTLINVIANSINIYLRPKIFVVFASRETTLTKYILKNINIYGT